MKRFERIAVAVSVSVGILFGYILCQSLVQVLFFLCAGLVKSGSRESLLELYERHLADVYLGGSLLYAALILAGLLIYKKVKKSHFTDFLKPPAGSRTLLFVFGTFALGMTLNLALSNLISLIPFPERWLSENSESVNSFAESNLLIMIIAQSLAAPLVEELIFRGVIYHGLRKAPLFKNKHLCILVSAVLVSAVFGWFHGNALQALYCFCFSLILILITEKTGSLWGAVITHIGFNSPWVLMIFMQSIYNSSAYLLNTVIFGALTAVFVLISLWAGNGFKAHSKA